uniref:Uncharacterized protein n=1 Tax=Anguilla anguilla TaxID=7936 RepID=A0A0E9VKE3_ANGAN
MTIFVFSNCICSPTITL